MSAYIWSALPTAPPPTTHPDWAVFSFATPPPQTDNNPSPQTHQPITDLTVLHKPTNLPWTYQPSRLQTQ